MLRTKRKFILLIAVILSCLLVTACSGADDNSNSSDQSAKQGENSNGNGSSSDVDLTAIKQTIEKYKGMPEVTKPGPSFDAKKASGDTVLVVPTSSTVPILKVQNEEFTKVMKRVGVKTIVYGTDGSPSSWVKAMNAAMGQKVDVIVLEGINPDLITPQLKQAKSAGIPVIWDFAVPGPVEKVAPNVTATVPLPFPQDGQLMADLAILKTGGKANVQLIGLKSQRQDSVYTNAIKKTLAAKSPESKVNNYMNVPISDWSNKLTGEISNLLRSDPDVNVLIPYYDGMVQFIAPGVQQAGKSKEVTIITNDGTPSVLKRVKQGSVYADIGISNDWQSWAVADQTLRVLTGTKPVTDEHIGSRIWDSTNISEATGTNAEDGYGDAYKSMYKKLWGIN